MGKRKKSSRKPQGPKKREPLATTFTCLFCNHEKAIQIKLEKKLGIGSLSCKVCGQRFQCKIHHLNGAVDVYSEWIDACETVAKRDANDELEKAANAANTANAEDLEFSAYGAGAERRVGAAGDGEDDSVNDDNY